MQNLVDWEDFLADLIGEIESGRLKCPPGTTVQELNEDLGVLLNMPETLFQAFMASLESWDEVRILDSLSGWLMALAPGDRPASFLRVTPLLQAPSLIWRAIHQNWGVFDVNSSAELSGLLCVYRPFWQKQYLRGADLMGYDALPELITLYGSKNLKKEISLT